MCAFSGRDKFKQTRKDLKQAIKEAEDYIENCSHSIGPRLGSDDGKALSCLELVAENKSKASKTPKSKKVLKKPAIEGKTKAVQSMIEWL